MPYTTAWTEWSSCSHSCGTGGTRTRVKYSYQLGSASAPTVETDSSCPGSSCPAASTDSDLTEWSSWSSCQLSLDGSTAFQVRDRECSTRHCSDALQEQQSCSHPLLSPGNLKYNTSFKFHNF